jgi:hypothetical protein
VDERWRSPPPPQFVCCCEAPSKKPQGEVLSSTNSCVRLEDVHGRDGEEGGMWATLFAAEISGGRITPLKMMNFCVSQPPQMTKSGSAFRCL